MSQRSWARLPQATLHPSALRRLPRAFPGGSARLRCWFSAGESAVYFGKRCPVVTVKGKRKEEDRVRPKVFGEASSKPERRAPARQPQSRRGRLCPSLHVQRKSPPGDGRPQACGQGAPGRLVTPQVRAARRARQGAATVSCRSDLAIDKNMTTAGRSTSSTCGFFLPM